MNRLIVFHGGTEIVEHPLSKYGRPYLDFGQGFYVTPLHEQAVNLATQTATRRKSSPILNKYHLNREAVILEAHCKIFSAYDKEWLEFIVANRKGTLTTDLYDYVEGGVANDRVIDTINLFMAGLMDEDMALRRLAEHQPNNQICMLSQKLIDKYLIFDGAESL